MTSRYGIDTSLLVRLVTGQPADLFSVCVEQLRTLVEDEGAELFASNQVVGETYVAVQHHYGVSAHEVRASLLSVLQSGLVSPLHGHNVLNALQATGGPGLFDRLITDDYTRARLEILTLDRKMATLPGVATLSFDITPERG